MGVVIYGRRAYGRVHQHEGEYADTQFAHIDFLPLFPVSSFWVTQDLGNGQRMGFPIKLNGRSVAATYLRIWGLPIGIGMLAGGSLPVAIAGAILLALSLYSWTWRSRRGAHAHRRSDFDRVALGSRCDPRWMTSDMRDRIGKSLETSLAKRDDARPPDDVARFGARDLNEAVLAYGLLRISSVKHTAAAASADRLLSSAFEQLPSDGGPYRESIGAAVPELGSAISAAARAAAEAARARRPVHKRWFHKPWVQLVGLLFLTPMALGGIAGIYKSIAPAHEVTAKQLGSTHPPFHERVIVACDAIHDLGWQVLRGDSVDEEIVFCQMGTHLLPVVSRRGESPTAAGKIDGEVRFIPDPSTRTTRNHPWVDALHADAELDGRSFDVYLKRDASDRRFNAVFGAVLTLAVVVAWFFWIRGIVRRRRATA
jgi:hypothetical protein